MRSGGGISNAPSSAASREPISLRPPGIQALASLETLTSRPPGIDHAHPGSYRDTMQRTHAALARLEHAERLTSSDGEVANAARVQRNALGARVEGLIARLRAAEERDVDDSAILAPALLAKLGSDATAQEQQLRRLRRAFQSFNSVRCGGDVPLALLNAALHAAHNWGDQHPFVACWKYIAALLEEGVASISWQAFVELYVDLRAGRARAYPTGSNRHAPGGREVVLMRELMAVRAELREARSELEISRATTASREAELRRVTMRIDGGG